MLLREANAQSAAPFERVAFRHGLYVALVGRGYACLYERAPPLTKPVSVGMLLLFECLDLKRSGCQRALDAFSGGQQVLADEHDASSVGMSMPPAEATSVGVQVALRCQRQAH